MLLEAYKHYSKYATQALKAAIPKGAMKAGMKGGDIPMNPRQMQAVIQKMSGALPPGILKNMGGPNGIAALMKGMEGMGMKM